MRILDTADWVQWLKHTQHSWKEHEVVLALEKECDIQCTSLENIHNPHLQNSVSAIVDENALKWSFLPKAFIAMLFVI